MNILIVIRSLDCGGAERQLTLLANSLAQRGHQVTVAVFYSGGVHEQDLAGGKVRLVALEKHSRFDMFGLMFRLRKLISELKPDIVHGYLSAGNLAALTARISSGRAKVIWAVRDSNMDMKRYGAMTRFASAVAGTVSHLADGVIANSRAGAEHAIANGYPRRRVIHIANGIDVEKFYPDSARGEQFRRSVGVNGGGKLVGLVGRLDPMKDHPTFLAATKFVKAARPGTRFVCVGGGNADYARSMKELAASMGLGDDLTWISSGGDMRAVYSGLDVFCLASQFGEGFPNVLGEAMACARSCVSTDVGDAAYVAGEAARIVPPRDPQALADAILADLNRGLRPEARERIVNNFSVTQMVTQTEQALAGWAGSPVDRTPLAAAAN